MKSKKTILAVLLAVCLLAAGFFIWKEVISHSKPADNGPGSSESVTLEDGGDVVIIVPEGQDSGGF